MFKQVCIPKDLQRRKNTKGRPHVELEKLVRTTRLFSAPREGPSSAKGSVSARQGKGLQHGHDAGFGCRTLHTARKVDCKGCRGFALSLEMKEGMTKSNPCWREARGRVGGKAVAHTLPYPRLIQLSSQARVQSSHCAPGFRPLIPQTLQGGFTLGFVRAV